MVFSQLLHSSLNAKPHSTGPILDNQTGSIAEQIGETKSYVNSLYTFQQEQIYSDSLVVTEHMYVTGIKKANYNHNAELRSTMNMETHEI